MNITLSIFGIPILSLRVEMPEVVQELEYEDGEEWQGSERLTTSDLSFGFSGDPAFPIFDWGDDEDREGHHESNNKDND